MTSESPLKLFTYPTKRENSASKGDAPEEVDCPARAPHDVSGSLFGVFDHLEASQDSHGLSQNFVLSAGAIKKIKNDTNLVRSSKYSVVVLETAICSVLGLRSRGGVASGLQEASILILFTGVVVAAFGGEKCGLGGDGVARRTGPGLSRTSNDGLNNKKKHLIN